MFLLALRGDAGKAVLSVSLVALVLTDELNGLPALWYLAEELSIPWRVSTTVS